MADGPDDGPSLLAQGVALVVYVVLGYFLKSVVLNWIVGPLFLVTVLYLVPAAFGRGRGGARRPGRAGEGRRP